MIARFSSLPSFREKLFRRAKPTPYGRVGESRPFFQFNYECNICVRRTWCYGRLRMVAGIWYFYNEPQEIIADLDHQDSAGSSDSMRRVSLKSSNLVVLKISRLVGGRTAQKVQWLVNFSCYDQANLRHSNVSIVEIREQPNQRLIMDLCAW